MASNVNSVTNTCSDDSSYPSGAEKDEFIAVKLAEIRKEFQCPICLGIIRKTRTVMECLHRFCRECIDKSMRLGKNECPACRTHCASRRSLRDDPNYDNLIAALFPDIDKEELAFHEEEKARNKQIQASMAQTFCRQAEALRQKRTSARATSVARPQGNYRNLRGRRNHPLTQRQEFDEEGANAKEKRDDNEEGTSKDKNYSGSRDAADKMPKVSADEVIRRLDALESKVDSKLHRLDISLKNISDNMISRAHFDSVFKSFQSATEANLTKFLSDFETKKGYKKIQHFPEPMKCVTEKQRTSQNNSSLPQHFHSDVWVPLSINDDWEKAKKCFIDKYYYWRCWGDKDVDEVFKGWMQANHDDLFSKLKAAACTNRVVFRAPKKEFYPPPTVGISFINLIQQECLTAARIMNIDFNSKLFNELRGRIYEKYQIETPTVKKKQS